MKPITGEAAKRLLERAGLAAALPAKTSGRPRHVPGEMNKTESDYAARLRLLLAAGEIAWFGFEAMKFRLADRTYLTPDFAVVLPYGRLELHEIKGHMEDDASVKIKVAAEMFPAFRWVVVRRVKGGGWSLREVGGR